MTTLKRLFTQNSIVFVFLLVWKFRRRQKEIHQQPIWLPIATFSSTNKPNCNWYYNIAIHRGTEVLQYSPSEIQILWTRTMNRDINTARTCGLLVELGEVSEMHTSLHSDNSHLYIMFTLYLWFLYHIPVSIGWILLMSQRTSGLLVTLPPLFVQVPVCSVIISYTWCHKYITLDGLATLCNMWRLWHQFCHRRIFHNCIAVMGLMAWTCLYSF